ncbi:MAG TPA: VWA domain-containing protein, partial [Campylobacterales bacterium]|nr:VWA domain-containing protein [Campylobacterales bacterium]
MIFLKPEYLTMMLIPTLILFYFIVTNKSALDTYFDEKILEKLRFENGTLGKIGRNILLFVALIMMIIALARPVVEKGDVQIKSKSIDMMVALDISKSMMAGDFYPSRLAFAKKRFVEFVDSFKEANIGIVAFSSEGFLVSPMTQDSSTLKYLVNNLSLDSMTLKGTNLLIPIEKGNAFLKESKDKIIIIFTDGGDKTDFTKEIERAKEYGESIYIYAVGTPEGGPIIERGESIKDDNGNIVITRLNESIKTLAFETGGAYIVGNHEDNSIDLMVKDIKKKFKMQDVKEKKIKEYKELFYYPLSVAVLFLLFAFHSFPSRMGGTIMIGLLAISVPSPSGAKVFDFFDIDKASAAYSDEKYEEASEHYKEVIKSNKSPESIYDLANAQYKQGAYKEALKNYQNVTAKTDALQYKKAFNSGNTYMQLKEYDKAIKAYEDAKKLKNEEDLEHNLALAKKKLAEKKKKEQQKKKDKKEDDKKKKDKKQGDGDSDKKDKKDDKK